MTVDYQFLGNDYPGLGIRTIWIIPVHEVFDAVVSGSLGTVITTTLDKWFGLTKPFIHVQSAQR